MKQMTRRDLAVLSGLTALGALAAQAQAPASGGKPDLLHSRLFSEAELPERVSANAMVTRSVMQGTLATGEFVEVHESVLPAGEMPHPPHRHTHSEFLLIREGRLEVMSDGQQGFVEAGGVIFTASGVLHSLKNVGTQPAKYFVVGIGLQHPVP